MQTINDAIHWWARVMPDAVALDFGEDRTISNIGTGRNALQPSSFAGVWSPVTESAYAREIPCRIAS